MKYYEMYGTMISPNFIVNNIFWLSEIFELDNILEGFISCLYVMILPCIVVTRHKHAGYLFFCDLRPTSRWTSFLASSSFCHFLRHLYFRSTN
jgi:hypothetical protein